MRPEHQLTLPFKLQEDATFANFVVSAANQNVIQTLQTLHHAASERFIYIWGTSASGRTHLLQACCQNAGVYQHTASYIPLREYQHYSPEILQGLENLSLVCLDDIDAIASSAMWQEAVFHLFNRLQVQERYLLITAPSAPLELKLSLPDLQSRLSSGLIFQLQALSDEEKIAVLQTRAKQKGLQLSVQVAEFLLRRCERNLTSLLNTLDQLDELSLQSQRRLTIPFVKQALKL